MKGFVRRIRLAAASVLVAIAAAPAAAGVAERSSLTLHRARRVIAAAAREARSKAAPGAVIAVVD